MPYSSSSIEGRSHSVNASPRALRQLVKTRVAGKLSAIDFLQNPGGKHDHGLFSRPTGRRTAPGHSDTAKELISARSGPVAYAVTESPASICRIKTAAHDRTHQKSLTTQFLASRPAGHRQCGSTICCCRSRASNKFRMPSSARRTIANGSRLPETTRPKRQWWPSRGPRRDRHWQCRNGLQRDQGQAGKSGFHLQEFLKNMFDLRGQLLAAHPQGRVFLLAHSMGNHALKAGIEAWFERMVRMN